MIDEVELHLHPGWQQRVIPDLLEVFPNTQLIIRTHSPQVLTTIRREHVHFLTAEHKLEPLPDEVGTYGAESGHVDESVFGVHTRPRTVETVDKLHIYLRMIEDRKHQTDKAKILRSELENDLGSSDPTLKTADMRIRQLTFWGKRNEGIQEKECLPEVLRKWNRSNHPWVDFVSDQAAYVQVKQPYLRNKTICAATANQPR